MDISSSESSQASVDSAPESEIDSPLKCRAIAATNDMSEKQTRKLKGGKFGMFNPAVLIPGTPRTSDSGKKRNRVQEYSDYHKTPPSRRTSGRQVGGGLENVRRGEDNGESLFVSDNTSPSHLPVADDESDLDDSFYGDLTSGRAQAAKDYLAALKAVDEANSNLKAVQKSLRTTTTLHKSMSEKLANIQATADDSIADIIRERDEAFRIASEVAESRIKKIRDHVPEKRDKYEETLRECSERKRTAERRVEEESAAVEAAETRKRELEAKGGFELCNDVRDIQAKRGRKRW